MPSIAQAEYGIKDVWQTNLEEEFRKIRHVVQQYKYVAMVSNDNFTLFFCATVCFYMYAALDLVSSVNTDLFNRFQW